MQFNPFMALNVNNRRIQTTRRSPTSRVADGRDWQPFAGIFLASSFACLQQNLTTSTFQPGDEVYGTSRGTCAEYVCTQGKVIITVEHNNKT